MKILNLILRSVIYTLFSSATPNLFGSRKRRKEKEKLSQELKGYADETQSEIDVLKSQNPFESAAAKSAMAESSRKSKQMAQRFSNTMGANATPESIIAGQQATQEAVAGTAGDIAVGSEALKQSQLNQLQNLKAGQLGQAAGVQQSAIDERGSGWNTLFQGLEAVGGIMEGVGAIS